MASQTLDTLAQLLGDPNPLIIKVVVSSLTAVYPLLFRLLCEPCFQPSISTHHAVHRCTNHSNPAAWNTLSACKARILDFVWAPTTTNGIRFSSIKFLQRVILVQTRGISDPRVLFLQPVLGHCMFNLFHNYSSRTRMILTSHSVRPTIHSSRFLSSRQRVRSCSKPS